MLRITTLSLAMSCLLLAGCGSENTQTIRTEDGDVTQTVSQNGGTTTIKTTGPDGEVMELQTNTGSAVKLPNGYTLYPGASVISNSTMDHGVEEGTMVVMQSRDTPEKISAFYRKQAEAIGIRIVSEARANETVMLAGEGNDGAIFSVNATPDAQGGTVAYLMVGKQG
ncbi:hypothetical protein GRI97_05280 [Altererythrobacter xixiisoli]|uniref:Lipoprotein n=1 Tax=Croceibacterium xixiisoli TaxID=1476466 RepID=A0A6I4TR43_9SPHN|nr:hypothetical protein [Croceibacterium xixiisoli]MXO98396.1 hypothetical protein [Croceibacterium xixiisoli]